MQYSLVKNIIYIYKKAFCFNKKLKFQIPLKIICEILYPIVSMAIPAVLISLITNKVNIRTFIFDIAGIIIFYTFVVCIFQYLTGVIDMENALVRLNKFQSENAEKLMDTDYINVEQHDKQILIEKAQESISTNWIGIELMMKSFPIFIVNIIGLIIYGTLICSINFAIILILIVMTILNMILSSYARNYEEKYKKDYVKYDKQIKYLYKNSTSLINGKDVRMYNMEKWFHNVFVQLIKSRVKWYRKTEYRYFLPFLSDNILLFVRDIIAYYILVSMAIDNQISSAAFTLYIGVVSGFSSWLNQVVKSYCDLKRANLGVNDYRTFQEMKQTFNHGDGCELPQKSDCPITIEFKNVSFKYPDSKTNVIKDLNLKIQGGSKIALVGNNGAGKTTLVKLLSGLYYPTKGDILVNGKSIKEYNIEEYYKLIGVVFQDVEILAFSIAKNIAACEESKIDYDKLNKCLKLADLNDKVDSLKHKENTYITQTFDKDGILLSGGQMQKMMLARALYKNAPIMILDEPTAALDPIAESKLYEKYNDLTKGKTSIFISHRLSSTKFCNRILMLDNGRIIEDGMHEELMKNNGQYAKMFEIQSHYYKKDIGGR